MDTSDLQTVKGFAAALDSNNFKEAVKYLAPTCDYVFRGQIIHGANSVTQQYQSDYEAGKGNFDEIQFTSEVKGLTPTTFLITFYDHLRIGDSWHVYINEQKVDTKEGKITKITHIDVPGEADRFKEFKRNNDRS